MAARKNKPLTEEAIKDILDQNNRKIVKKSLLFFFNTLALGMLAHYFFFIMHVMEKLYPTASDANFGVFVFSITFILIFLVSSFWVVTNYARIAEAEFE